eukprot:6213761-Pleurochrysis_carterae.AAC.2
MDTRHLFCVYVLTIAACACGCVLARAMVRACARAPARAPGVHASGEMRVGAVVFADARWRRSPVRRQHR